MFISTCEGHLRLSGATSFFRAACSSASLLSWSPQHDLFTSNQRMHELARLGRVDNARQIFDEMVQRDAGSWNTMISGYAQNGRVEDARKLFDTFLGKDTRSWTSMITCYAKNGQLREARRMFDEMPSRNIVSWNAMISGYVHSGDLDSARELFEQMPEQNIISWNLIISGYSQCLEMDKACQLFDQMREKNVASWSIIISGHVHSYNYLEAWGCFCRMHHSDVLVDQRTLVITLSAVTQLNSINLIKSLHAMATKVNLEGDVVVGTAILNSYSLNGWLDSASRLFDTMPERNDFTWTTMISAFCQSSRITEAIAVYEKVPKQTVTTQTAMLTGYAQMGRIIEARLVFDQILYPNIVSYNALLAGYMQNGMIKEAWEFFDIMPSRNDISWAAMISGCAQNGMNYEALRLFAELHRLGIIPTHSSLTSSFLVCAQIGSLEMGKQVHAFCAKTGCHLNAYVGNGLITMYAKCRQCDDVSRAFSTMRIKDVVTWNSMISGLCHNYLFEEARKVFRTMPRPDVVSWTSVISAQVQAGHEIEACNMFTEMLEFGILPASSTVACILSASASLGFTKVGEQIHNLICKIGLDLDLYVGNALISMYCKCGSMLAFSIFDEMSDRDIVTWNSLIVGAAQQGFGSEAVQFFEQMKIDGILPNHMSFMGILLACSHAGLIEEGWHYFNSMSRDYGLVPAGPHYACMVDLLGRAGCLNEAYKFIKNMPIEPDSVIWASLLAACKIHQNVHLARVVAEKLFKMDPSNPGYYILLSNIYASAGMWEEVMEVRKLMKAREVTKVPGFSWMQLKDKLHYFVTGDRTHEQSSAINSVLEDLYSQLRDNGYMPDTGFVLHDMELEQKENVLLYHSEKLAMAFGLLMTPIGAKIEIIKNLRVCGDCHTFAKFISMVTKRVIVIRDVTRFHHFHNGLCSCRDYW